ncbi:hypothetical protein [Occallatibacter riparius]|uniref:Uncharacterized protein n=1 Tax=Occallatibacter riparius TaxID=1002689 RepID=A0A9J7BVU5_9BACT|nr:hypothetical protein [Occallatibacter riparius]UWZ86823.1 hypothetical protein MOP44_12945 [Occallatibacter riparius]
MYFARKENVGPSLDIYEPIRKMLFESIVVDELFYKGTADGTDILPPALKVVPKHRSRLLVKALGSQGKANYWGEGGDLYVSPDDITLSFIDYYDFSNISLRDFQYYRCKILRFPSHSDYEGREALLQAMDGGVFHDEEHDDDPS